MIREPTFQSKDQPVTETKLKLKARHGLDHLVGIAGIPSYARPSFPLEPAYFTADALQREGNRYLPEGGEWDPAGATWWWISRREELRGPWDNRGRWDPADSLSWEARATPVVDGWTSEILAAAEAVAQEAGHPLVRLALWPHGAPFSFSGTHDVDHARKWRLPTIASYMLGRGGPARLSRWQVLAEVLRRSEPWWHFETIREIEREVGSNSTWFVTPHRRHPDDPYFHLRRRRDRQQITKLRQEGQELAVHGSYVGLDDPLILGREWKELGKPAGIRQHYLRFRVEKSWPAQVAAGFAYDSSLGFSHGWGFRAGTAFPFRAWDHTTEEPLPLGELPLALMDREGMDNPKGVARKLMEAIGQGHLNVLWHVAIFDDRDYPGWGEAYHYLLGQVKAAGAWMAPCGEVWNWWRNRNRVKIVPSSKGITITSPAPLEGLVLLGPLEAPEGGEAFKGGVCLPPLISNQTLEVPWR